MRICQIASALAIGAFIVEACGGDLPKADTTPPPPGLAPDASLPPQAIEGDASASGLDVRFVKGHVTVRTSPCSRVFIVAAAGEVTALKDTLQFGDVMIVKYPDAFSFDVQQVALLAIQPFMCQLLDKPGAEVSIRRAANGQDLTWAQGKMHAKMLVSGDVSPSLYLGLLDGTAAVAEHKHDHSTEILAAMEAHGAFTQNGQEKRVENEQIVTIPENTLHSWKPDPGARLVAIQIYVPPGPEQRFVALDAAEKDASAQADAASRSDGGKIDGGKNGCDPPYYVDGRGLRRPKPQCVP